jgi:ferric-dicitrate binding protein FerR (iron transport regulator)
VTKEELKNVIRNHYSEAGKIEFVNWVLSENFDKDLDQFITEDLTNELLQKHQIEDTVLNAMAGEILMNARETKSATDKSHSITSYSGDWQRRSGIGTVYKIAASVVLIALFAFVAFYFSERPTDEIQADQMVIKENQRGRKSTIFLKDGSIVYLNAESKIEFPEVFSDTTRVVYLEGEAYFDVARDESKPFIVRTDNLKIRVLGTSFNINAYEENEFVKVSLNTGKVEVENEQVSGLHGNKIIELNAGQCVSYSSRQNTFTAVSEFDHNVDLGWKDGNIVFENADMETMVNRFERWYNVDIVLKNSPYFKWNYTGEFQNQTLQDVLESLSFSQSFDYTIDQEQVELVFKPN